VRENKRERVREGERERVNGDKDRFILFSHVTKKNNGITVKTFTLKTQKALF